MHVRQVRESQRLRQVLAATLAAGNALNVGTTHTGALGFSVGTLQKLSSLKVLPNEIRAGIITYSILAVPSERDAWHEQCS